MGKRRLHYRKNHPTNRHEARCTNCLRLVAFISDEALYNHPEAELPSLLRPVLHNCPCTCDVDPYTCPVGRALTNAILERKGNQENVRTA